MHTIYIKTFVVSKTSYFWKKFLMLTMAALFDQKYSKNSNGVKYNYKLRCFFIWIYFEMLFIPVMTKLNC